jgi:argininosuccinate lyase
MPGFTHLQVAQPITFGHHLLAWFEMTRRDAERFADVRRAPTACRSAPPRWPARPTRSTANSSPPNSASKASAKTRSTPFPTATSRSNSALPPRCLMMHFSRMSEELVLWMNPRFGFVKIADRFCTGSSIMPQKKNPDVPELARGKTGRVYGHLTALLTLMKGQPLAYNKDNQEDKEPLFDAVDTVTDTLRIFADMIPASRPARTTCATRCARASPRRPTSPTT